MEPKKVIIEKEKQENGSCSMLNHDSDPNMGVLHIQSTTPAHKSSHIVEATQLICVSQTMFYSPYGTD